MSAAGRYVFDDLTGRWHDANTGAVVEWHDFDGVWRFSFDIRVDCSRFIVVKLKSTRDGVTTQVLVASGLIDPAPGRGAAPIAVFDLAPSEELPWMLPFAIADKWNEMRERLREAGARG